jgi:hypothetical protein
MFCFVRRAINDCLLRASYPPLAENDWEHKRINADCGQAKNLCLGSEFVLAFDSALVILAGTIRQWRRGIVSLFAISGD